MLEHVIEGFRPAAVDDCEKYLLFVIEIGVESASGISRRFADLLDRGIVEASPDKQTLRRFDQTHTSDLFTLLAR